MGGGGNNEKFCFFFLCLLEGIREIGASKGVYFVNILINNISRSTGL